MSSITNITLKPEGQVAPVKADSPITPTLAPGSVVQVTARENFQGQSGVFYQGRFIPAQLPGQLQDGAKLLVQVQATIDAMVLKILGSDTARIGTKRSERTVGDLLKELFTEVPTENLPKITRGPVSAPPTEAKQAIQHLLEQLSELPIPLRADEFETPEQTEKALLELFTKNVSGKLGELIQKTKPNVRETLPQQDVKILQEMKTTIEELLKSESELSVPDHIDYLPLHQATFLPAKGVPQALPREIKLFIALMKSADDFQLSIHNHESPAHAELSDLVKEVIQTFAKIRKERPADSEVRPQLKALAEKIQQFVSKSADVIDEQRVKRVSHELLETLHQLSTTSDVLRQMNTCVGVMGEPVLLLIPVLMDGFLSKWQLSVQAPPIEDEEKRAQGEQEALKRITLNIPLPGLGDVGVEMAYRSKELLLAVSVANDGLCEFLSQKLPNLEEVLKAAGFEKLSLGVRPAPVRDATPEWYHEVTKRSIIA